MGRPLDVFLLAEEEGLVRRQSVYAFLTEGLDFVPYLTMDFEVDGDPAYLAFGLSRFIWPRSAALVVPGVCVGPPVEVA